MGIRDIKKSLYRRLKLILSKRKEPMLPRAGGVLDATKIDRIVILTDSNGKPFLVIAYSSGDGAPFHESYSAELNSLILSSGLPWVQEPAPGAITQADDNDGGGDSSPATPKNKA